MTDPRTSEPGQGQKTEDEAASTEEQLQQVLVTSLAAAETLEEREWAAVDAVIRSEAGSPVQFGTFGRLSNRVRWALESFQNDLSSNTHAFLSLLAMPPNSAMSQTLFSDVSEQTTSWVRYLTATYGDWISDLLLADSRGFRNWAQIDTRPLTVHSPASDLYNVELLIFVIDGEVLRLEMSAGSLVRLIRALARRVAVLPSDHLSSIPTDDWDDVKAAMDVLKELAPEESSGT